MLTRNYKLIRRQAAKHSSPSSLPSSTSSSSASVTTSASVTATIPTEVGTTKTSTRRERNIGSQDPWGSIFDELPDSNPSSLSINMRKGVARGDYFTRNEDAPVSSVSSSSSPASGGVIQRGNGRNFFSKNPLGRTGGISTRTGAGTGSRSFSSSAQGSYPQESTRERGKALTGWDHVFENIESTPFVPPPQISSSSPIFSHSPITPRFHPDFKSSAPTNLNATLDLFERKSSRTVAHPLTSRNRAIRRQSMTAREVSAFDDMFNMLFNAVAPESSTPESSTSNGSPFSSTSRQRQQHNVGAGVGFTHGNQSQSQSRTRDSTTSTKEDKYTKKIRLPRTLTEEEIQLLDKKKEDIERCGSDYELLMWAEKELFLDSIERLRVYNEWRSRGAFFF